jgi:hypothetical protein
MKQSSNHYIHFLDCFAYARNDDFKCFVPKKAARRTRNEFSGNAL